MKRFHWMVIAGGGARRKIVISLIIPTGRATMRLHFSKQYILEMLRAYLLNKAQ